MNYDIVQPDLNVDHSVIHNVYDDSNSIYPSYIKHMWKVFMKENSSKLDTMLAIE
jgi:hypothetical protein